MFIISGYPIYSMTKGGRPIAFSYFDKSINGIIIAPKMIANKYHFFPLCTGNGIILFKVFDLYRHKLRN